MDPGTHPKDREATIGSGGVLAVGILTGGGFPGAAACVSLMLERCFPDERWPWSEGPL
jgi:hypothetical protein